MGVYEDGGVLVEFCEVRDMELLDRRRMEGRENPAGRLGEFDTADLPDSCDPLDTLDAADAERILGGSGGNGGCGDVEVRGGDGAPTEVLRRRLRFSSTIISGLNIGLDVPVLSDDIPDILFQNPGLRPSASLMAS